MIDQLGGLVMGGMIGVAATLLVQQYMNRQPSADAGPIPPESRPAHGVPFPVRCPMSGCRRSVVVTFGVRSANLVHGHGRDAVAFNVTRDLLDDWPNIPSLFHDRRVAMWLRSDVAHV